MCTKFTPSLLGLLLLGLAACGEGPETEVPIASMEGPPRWRLLSEENPGHGGAMSLQIRTPVRVRFRATQTGAEEQASRWRVLAAGQVVRVAWEHHAEPSDAIEDLPSPDDVAAGRTEPHAIRFIYQFADRAVHVSRLLVFARKDRGHVASAEVLPPGKYEELPIAGRVELATVLVSDLQKGEASLRRRNLETLLVRPGAVSQGDQVRVMRLFLEIQPAGEPDR